MFKNHLIVEYRVSPIQKITYTYLIKSLVILMTTLSQEQKLSKNPSIINLSRR